MTPYFEALGVELWCAGWEEIPDRAVDCVIADPPYGINYFPLGGHKSTAFKGKPHSSKPIIGDDQDFDPRPLLKYGNVLLWGADHYSMRLPHGRWLAWDKLAGFQSWDSFSDVEFAWHSQRGAARIFSLLWKGIARSKFAEDTKRYHPSQKPVSLMQWCIKEAGAPSGATVFDPYMGSGTTGVACALMGRKFIGCEIDESYCEIAKERIIRALAQPRLDFEEIVHKQLEMVA